MIYIYRNLIKTTGSNLHLTRVNFLFKSSFSTKVNYEKVNIFARNILTKSSQHNAFRLNNFIRHKSAKVLADSAPKNKVKVNELRRLISLAKPFKFRIGLAMVFLLIGSGVSMSVPFFIGRLIDFIQAEDKNKSQEVLVQEKKEKLQNISIAMLGVFFVGALAVFGRAYLIQSTGQQIVMRLRKKLFESMMAQEMAFFDRSKTGELINRLSSDAEIVGLSISQNLSDGMRSFIQGAGGIGMMFYVSPYLAAVGLSIVPAVSAFAVIFGRYIKNLSKKIQDVLAEATNVSEEKISNIRTVRAFAQEEKELKLYSKNIDNVMKMKFKEATANGVFYGVNGFSGNFIILSVFYFAGGSIAEGAVSIGDLSSFLLYSAYVGISLAGLSSFYSGLLRGIGASTRIWEIIDRKPEIPSIPKSGCLISTDILGADIRFENINFAYPTRIEQNILTNLDLVIPGGKILAVVGPSGSGKSTVASLMLRFYDPQSGCVKIGDKDIRDLPQNWLRNNIGTVPQEPILFSMSIKDNIAYGAPNPEKITNEQIYAAAVEANAYTFIDQFPDKFETIIGERGINLSGGQKQRIAIARAILRNPRILLLDEATSALDAASEYLVQEALEKIMKKRTVIIIAHRLSTIKNADLIAVLDKGHVVELGTFEKLMLDDNGLFKQLVSHQTLETDYEV